jgi:hypothetical protein
MRRLGDLKPHSVMSSPVRATLVICTALAACEAPVSETYEQVQENYSAPITAPEQNIETIGAQGLCASAAEAVTEDQNGLEVTYCENAARPPQPNGILIRDGEKMYDDGLPPG